MSRRSPSPSPRPEELFFISYRRKTETGFATRLRSEINRLCGPGCAWLDDKIPRGTSFPKYLKLQIRSRPIMLVVVGKTWVAEFANRRQSAEIDYVRKEVELGLKLLKGERRVVPIFERSRFMPNDAAKADDPLLKKLGDLQGEAIPNDRNFETRVEAFLRELAEHFPVLADARRRVCQRPEGYFAARIVNEIAGRARERLERLSRDPPATWLPDPDSLVVEIGSVTQPIEYWLNYLQAREGEHVRNAEKCRRLDEVVCELRRVHAMAADVRDLCGAGELAQAQSRVDAIARRLKKVANSLRAIVVEMNAEAELGCD